MRTWIYQTLKASPLWTTLAQQIYQTSRLIKVPTDKPYLIYRVGVVSGLLHTDAPALSTPFQLFFHDEPGDFMRIEDLMAVAKTALTVRPPLVAEPRLICCEWAYRQFLQQNLMPGGTLFLVECQYKWPATQVSDRHFFQVGGKGGIHRAEYVEGSPRVAEFLKQQGSEHSHWHSPPSDGDWPEAEWGFEPALREDAIAFAEENGFKVQRIMFDDPQSLSPLVADLHRWWYDQLGVPSDRLLAESFVYLHPWLCMRLGLVPYWTVFNDQTSLGLLKDYLQTTEPYDDIYLTLFSNGINSLGIAPIEQWRSEILSQARRRGEFLGVKEQRFPRDNASIIQHYLDLKQMPGQFPIPEPLTLHQLGEFLEQRGDRYAVDWLS